FKKDRSRVLLLSMDTGCWWHRRRHPGKYGILHVHLNRYSMKVVYLIMLLCIGHIYSMAQQKAEKIDSPFDNLYKVSDSIFRSEQPDSLGVVFLQENGFKSILNIKTRQTDAAFDTEGIHLYHVKMRA